MNRGLTCRVALGAIALGVRSSNDPADAAMFGNLAGEIKLFLGAGMVGFFTDHPDIGVRLRDHSK